MKVQNQKILGSESKQIFLLGDKPEIVNITGGRHILTQEIIYHILLVHQTKD